MKCRNCGNEADMMGTVGRGKEFQWTIWTQGLCSTTVGHMNVSAENEVMAESNEDSDPTWLDSLE